MAPLDVLKKWWICLHGGCAAEKVRGGGARSCDGCQKRRREWRKMVVAAMAEDGDVLQFGGRRGDGDGGCHGGWKEN
ncbi:hypothetical protein DEO72_LG5g1355 [Vigna unguiculata]|uniref:Uncharacterized protein n=1 Tax=Vigna unguiculata TaxID=3917 RepID=A0A4D6LXS1_VIGUN|nr:hypothetical protein DEO72_LG5g1355 [Vigna unguiculata]